MFVKIPEVWRCSRCKELKAETEFGTRGAGRLQTNCRACNAAYLREHYRANRAYHMHYPRLFAFVADRPCVDCGETDPVVLQFDHVRGKKKANVGNLVAGGYPWSRIEAEIAKCEVRCANCDWRRTAKQFNWYAFLGDGGG